MSAAPQRTPIDLGKRFRANEVMMRGEGRPLIYLHGPFGQEWSGTLDALSTSRKVIAPANVGARDLDELVHMDGILDLMLYYDEVFDHLDLDTFDIVGHSYGGMVAAEYAAVYPARVNRLVLIGPLGLWDENRPVADYNYAPPERQFAMQFHDVANPEVQALVADEPTEIQDIIASRLDMMTSLGSTNHFLWPIPERGLHKRLDRIKAPTLLLWGKEDAIVPPSYAQDFAAAIRDTKTVMIDNAGHAVQVEQPETTARAILEFLS